MPKRARKKGSGRKATVVSKRALKARKHQDRVTINFWRTHDELSIEEALGRATKSVRQAKRFKLSRTYEPKFVRTWFLYDAEVDDGRKTPYADLPKGGTSKYTTQHKSQLVNAFQTQNNDPSQKTGLNEFCRENIDTEGCNSSNISRWCRDPDIVDAAIHPYAYRAVPWLLDTTGEVTYILRSLWLTRSLS